MLKCMKTDKPLVSILMAVYKPNKRWLVEQLISLNEQTYSNLELYVYDDCPESPINEKIFREYINNFKFTLIHGKENRGSNKAFEYLTKIAEGSFFAYCDQDDIWEKDKIEIMVKQFENNEVTLVCSDLCIIDENGKKVADSITKIRKRIVYKSGICLTNELLMTNFITGCAMVVKKNIAKKALPFANTIIHDQWIGIVASLEGRIQCLDSQQLVKYRQHGNNQTGILMGVSDKSAYYVKQIDRIIQRYVEYNERIGNDVRVKDKIEITLKWLRARKNYSIKPKLKDLIIMIKYRRIRTISIVLESILPVIPNFIFKFIIKLAQKGFI